MGWKAAIQTIKIAGDATAGRGKKAKAAELLEEKEQLAWGLGRPASWTGTSPHVAASSYPSHHPPKQTHNSGGTPSNGRVQPTTRTRHHYRGWSRYKKNNCVIAFAWRQREAAGFMEISMLVFSSVCACLCVCGHMCRGEDCSAMFIMRGKETTSFGLQEPSGILFFPHKVQVFNTAKA